MTPILRFLALGAVFGLSACATSPAVETAAPQTVPGYEAVEDGGFLIEAVEARHLSGGRKRTEVAYNGTEKPGTIVVDPKKRYLYLVLGNGKAIRYGASVGKAGRTWSGQATIGRMEKWPTWTPTPEHIAEFPKLVKWQEGGMPGGPENPMGARALYLYQGDVDTIYRIHGSHDPSMIGRKKTAGCVSLLNVDIIDLYNRVQMGTKVVVLEY